MSKKKGVKKQAPRAVPKSAKVLLGWELESINKLLASMLQKFEKLEKAPWHPAGYMVSIDTYNSETGEITKYAPLNFRQGIESLEFLIRSNPIGRIVIDIEKEEPLKHHIPGL